MKTGTTNTGAIAVVDDDDPLREALASILKASGYAVSAFGSAEEFLESFDRQKPACLVLDVRLPGMSGIELQRHMIETSKSAPIIFVTAHADDCLREALMRAGARSVLPKPVRSDTLLAEIDKAIS